MVAAGAFGVGLLLPSGTPVAVPAGPPSTPGPTVEPDGPVPHDEIVQRCLPQLEQLRQSPRFELHPESGYSVAFTDREYRVGEPVTLYAQDQYEFTCLLPAEDEPVVDVFQALTPSLADPAAFTALCSEHQGRHQGQYGDEERAIIYDAPDLRGAEILTSAEVDGMATALLRHDGFLYGCSLKSPGNDFGEGYLTPFHEVDVAAPVELGYWSPIGTRTLNGEGGKSVVPGEHAYYYGGFFAPEGVRTIELAGQVNGTVEVDEDGRYSFLLRGDAPNGLESTTWVAKDAEGRVVAEGVADDS